MSGRAAHAAPPAPTPVTPGNGAGVVVPFTISWSAVTDPSGIIGYNWQVSRSSSFTPLVLMDSTNPATTEDTVSGLTPATYFWRVQAVNGAFEQGAWSSTRSFNVTGAGPGAPGTPVLGPTQGYSTFHPWEAIRFNWSAVPDAVTYRLEVSNDPNFPVGPVPPGTQTFWNDNIPTNTDGYIHTMVGNWFARVFAVSADNPQEGIRSLPSNVIQFSCFFDNPIGPPPVLLSPVDDPTLTLPVTLAWAHVPNPQPMGYVLEVARDPGFSDIEWFFNQYTEPSTEMLSLTSGSKFWRVLSQHGLSSPTTNANTDWSTTGQFTISSAPATPVSITVRGTTGFEYSGAERRVAVQLTAGVPPGGAAVALASSHPALAPLPATLSMPGTHAWSEIPIILGQVTSPTLVTLTATLNGVSASNQFTLRPPTLNDDILQSVVRATGGVTMTGWVDLEGGGLAGPGGFNVDLSTNSPAAEVPASVTIPAGVSGTSFSIQTSPVAETTVVTITASAGNVTTQWQITLTAEPAPTSLLVRPMSTTNGSQGVVRAAEGVGHDQLMQVASSNPALAAVPGSVTVAAVSGIGFFDITTAPVTAPTGVTISVSGGGVTLSHPLTLYPVLPALTALTVNPTTVVGGNPATGTVTLASPAPPVGVAVNLGSNLPLTASVPASVTIPGGATSASFTVTTFPSFSTTVQLSAAMDNVFQFAAITVNPPASTPTLSAVTVNPTSVVGGNSSTGTVTLSAPAPSGGAIVSLSDNSTAAATPSSIAVPSGASSANFTITTTSVTSATAATISAVYAGVTRTASLTVNPPALSALSLSPTSVVGGSSSLGTATLTGAAPSGGAAVTLSSSNTAVATVPASITVAAGATSATFTVTTSAVASPTVVTITGASGGATRTADLTVAPSGGGGAPGFQSPTTNAADSGGDGNGLETSPSNAHGDDTLSAADNNSGSGTGTSCTSSGKDRHRFYNYGFSIPNGQSITGIEVRLDARADSTSGAPKVCVQLSWDGGTTWTAAKATGSLGTSMATFMLGSSSDTWGRTWSASNLTNASFRLRVIDVSSSTSRDFFLDWVGVRVHTGAAAPATLSAVSLSPATVVGGNPSTGTVTLTAAAPTGGAVVSLSSSNTAAATVPTSVTVADGATTATFTVTSTTVTAATAVTITGAFGGATRTATLTVNPAPSLSAVTVSPTSVTGGSSSTGTVTLTSAAPTGGAVVTLSDDSTAATVPASVTVLAGATSATFTITTSTVTASTPVTITGSFGGATRTATLTVNPAGAAVTLTVTASGRSGERITSNPAGINVAVGSTGSAGFTSGSAVTLSVTNGRDAIWSGACSSGGDKTRTCTFTITGNASVTGNVQ